VPSADPVNLSGNRIYVGEKGSLWCDTKTGAELDGAALHLEADQLYKLGHQ
jgi:hypothetical protein